MITKDQAVRLRPRNIVHYTGASGKHPNGQPCTKIIGPRGGESTVTVECRVSGWPKEWKRSPERFRVPVKHGMYDNGSITEDNAQWFHLASDCVLRVIDNRPLTETGAQS